MIPDPLRRRLDRLEAGTPDEAGPAVYIYDPAWSEEERRARAPPSAILWLPDNGRDQLEPD